MRNTFAFRRNRLVLGVASALSLGFASSLFADIDNLDLNLKSQKVSEALVELGKKAGVQIMVEHNVRNDIELAKIQGVYSLSEALQKMLKGSGLIYEFVSDDLVIVKEDSKDDKEAEAHDEVEEVVVTGSRLRGVDPVAPVIVIDRAEIERRGVFSAEEIIRTLPQNFAATNSSSTISNSGTGEFTGGFSDYDAAGISAANLRGLGEGSTLVLINGRRTAGTPLDQGQFVNLSTIPAHDIERVEVVTQGASALYGADAVGGVINIILKKDREPGGSTMVRYETSANGQDRLSLTQTGSVAWGSGNANVTLGYTKTDPIDAQKVGYVSNDFRSRGGTDRRGHGIFGATVSPFVSTGLWFRGAGVTASDDYNGVIDTNGDGVNSPEEMAAALDQYFEYDRDGVFRENLSAEMSPDVENKNLSFRVEQELTDSILVFGSVNYNLTNNVFGGAPAPGVTVFSSTTAPGLSMPADNPYNPFGTSKYMRYTFYGEVESGLVPDAYRETDQKRIDGTVGLTWDLPVRDWRLETTFTRSEAKTEGLDVGLLTRHSRLDGSGNPYVLDDDGNPVLDDDGNPVMDTRSPLERLIQGDHPITGERITDPDEMINLFGNGTVQTPLLALAVGQTRNQQPTNTTFEYSASIEGSIADLPGGEVRSILGFEYHNATVDYSGNEDRAQSAPGVTGGFFKNLIELDKDVIELFTQTSIPLVGEDNRMTGVERLSLNVAARWGDYTYNKPTTTEGQVSGGDIVDVESLFQEASYNNLSPSVGISWYPVEDLNIRANWTENFRTPRFTDLVGGGYGAGYQWLEWADGSSFRASPVRVGNPNLKPETSDNLAIGLDWTPSFLDGLKLSVTWQTIATNDAIGSQITAGLNGEELIAKGVLIEDISDANGYKFITSPINYDERLRTFTDFSVTYDFASDYGLFSTGLSGTYFSKNNVHVTDADTGVADVYKYDATNYGPNRWQARGHLLWDYDNYSASFAVNYGSDYTWHNGLYSRSSFSEAIEDHVEHYITYDLTGSYETDRGWRFVGGVTDLTNQSLPFVNSGFGFDTSKVRVQGRTLFFQMQKNYSL
ncbi:TonB-dependent receptor [Porticoccaceae bacterium LTM1]|nr:TonB-dependent receptor [Porticoccaceae bacterium LTM1]